MQAVPQYGNALCICAKIPLLHIRHIASISPKKLSEAGNMGLRRVAFVGDAGIFVDLFGRDEMQLIERARQQWNQARFEAYRRSGQVALKIA